jgi:hypothetical protein
VRDRPTHSCDSTHHARTQQRTPHTHTHTHARTNARGAILARVKLHTHTYKHYPRTHTTHQTTNARTIPTHNPRTHTTHAHRTHTHATYPQREAPGTWRSWVRTTTRGRRTQRVRHCAQCSGYACASVGGHTRVWPHACACLRAAAPAPASTHRMGMGPMGPIARSMRPTPRPTPWRATRCMPASNTGRRRYMCSRV